MTPAELKTLRESLGLSLNWLAEQAGVSVRSAQYWESGERTVPENVGSFIAEIEVELEKTVQKTVQNVMYFMQAHGGPPECIDMIRYRTDEDLWHFQPDMRPMPAAYHAVIIQRTRRELFKIGCPSRIVYMRPDDYGAWLKNEGRNDDSGARAEWAAMQDR